MEDLIDFPCSDDWLDHYHRMGLTPRHSGRPSPEMQALVEEVREMQKVNQKVLEALDRILDRIERLEKGLKKIGLPELDSLENQSLLRR